MTLAERLTEYIRLVRLDKPIGILLLLWPTLWGQWFASGGNPDALILAIFVAGVVLMRSAGCAVNDYADRDIDPHVARTRLRPLAAGRIRPAEALAVAAVLAAAAFLLVLPLDPLVIALAFPAAFLAASYPFTKRFFAMPQAYLGIAFGFGIPMSYAAYQGTVPPEAWLLLAANTLWTIAYDTEYAMVDRDDDLRLGIRTSAITFGRHDRTAIAVCYAGALGLLAWAGALNALGWAYYAGLGAAGAIALYHLGLIAGRTREGCFRAFLHNTWFGAAVFAGLVLATL